VPTTADRFAAFVAEAAQRFGVLATWIRVVMRAESFGEVRAISPEGAMGLMQIMPETWARLRVRYGLGVDPYDEHKNILGGAAYLRELYDRYGAPGFLAAYNAGPTRYEDHLATGRPLPAETCAYVADVVGKIEEFTNVTNTSCWRLLQIVQAFQGFERHRSESPGGAGTRRPATTTCASGPAVSSTATAAASLRRVLSAR
jgi:hypothetical protein